MIFAKNFYILHKIFYFIIIIIYYFFWTRMDLVILRVIPLRILLTHIDILIVNKQNVVAHTICMICILYRLLRYSFFVCYIIFLFKKKSPISRSTPTCSPLRPEASTILWAIQLAKVEKWPCIVIEGNAKNWFDPLSSLLTIPGLGEIVI